MKPKVGRIDVHATDVTGVVVDQVSFEGGSVYVVPGSHLIEGRATTSARETVRVTPNVAAGEVVSVVLAPPREAPSTAGMIDPLETIDSTPPPPVAKSAGVSPMFVVVGGALTAVATGLTVWSGLSTLSRRDRYVLNRDQQTQENYDDGKAAQTRTNVLLAVTGGVAVLTAVTAVFFVDWHGTRSTAMVGVGPGSVVLRGSLP